MRRIRSEIGHSEEATNEGDRSHNREKELKQQAGEES
jgi:hypothetical protein